ncbi:MAG: DUF6502 family protein [Steroidobacteraceae bacterium]
MKARFKSYVDNPPRSLRRAGRGARLEIHDPAHVLTLWLTDPECVDAYGRPRALPLKGSTGSIESLVRRVSSSLSAEDALSLLLDTGTVKRNGRKYLPKAQFVLHRRQSQTQAAHHLKILNALVRNFQFNAKLKVGDLSWPQRVAECPDFPANDLGAFISKFDERTIAALEAEDRTMARIAHESGKGTRRVRATVHYFFSLVDESRPKTAASSRSRQKSLGSGPTPRRPAKASSP